MDNDEMNKINNKWRVEASGEVWICIKGEDFYGAPLFDTESEANAAADSMNGINFDYFRED